MTSSNNLSVGYEAALQLAAQYAPWQKVYSYNERVRRSVFDYSDLR